MQRILLVLIEALLIASILFLGLALLSSLHVSELQSHVYSNKSEIDAEPEVQFDTGTVVILMKPSEANLFRAQQNHGKYFGFYAPTYGKTPFHVVSCVIAALAGGMIGGISRLIGQMLGWTSARVTHPIGRGIAAGLVFSIALMSGAYIFSQNAPTAFSEIALGSTFSSAILLGIFSDECRKFFVRTTYPKSEVVS